ncbi:hypothetical protein M426DRAFT_22843 [Hypoxylon sp. CI-4A]|nr:hypothetical protein M426DRAFT_22843 [Hypoxylon sp. CI-4A]
MASTREITATDLKILTQAGVSYDSLPDDVKRGSNIPQEVIDHVCTESRDGQQVHPSTDSYELHWKEVFSNKYDVNGSKPLDLLQVYAAISSVYSLPSLGDMQREFRDFASMLGTGGESKSGLADAGCDEKVKIAKETQEYLGVGLGKRGIPKVLHNTIISVMLPRFFDWVLAHPKGPIEQADPPGGSAQDSSQTAN